MTGVSSGALQCTWEAVLYNDEDDDDDGDGD